MWISPAYQEGDFVYPLSLDDKITLFEDRMRGWKLDIADQMINGRRRQDGSSEQPPLQHSGYAILDIVTSYFEMISKYENGFAMPGDSESYFKRGVHSVFPVLQEVPPALGALSPVGEVESIVHAILDILYEGVRCGLYHSGITKGRVMLTGDIQAPMAYDPQVHGLMINPGLLVRRLKTHLADYVERLRDVRNTALRTKFEARYDFDTAV